MIILHEPLLLISDFKRVCSPHAFVVLLFSCLHNTAIIYLILHITHSIRYCGLGKTKVRKLGSSRSLS